MAFRKLAKPRRYNGVSTTPAITISRGSATSTSYLALNAAAFTALGEPAAVYFEYDDEEFKLAITASSPDDPAAYKLGKHRRIAISGLTRELGWAIQKTTKHPAQRRGRLSLVIDVSELPAATTITPIRSAA